VVPLH